MKQMKISKAEARRFLIHYHGLDSTNVFSGEKGILEYIRRVGCIQYDPLNVVGRNADLVLQSRIKGYHPVMLEKLLYTDRSLMDGWDKMMAIYLQEDWPFFHRIRKQKDIEVRATLRNRKSLEAIDMTQEMREIISSRGPLQATQIKLGEGGEGRWGHRRLSSAALDYMFNIGELGVYTKKSNHKVYDLIENLLPKELLEAADPFESDHDFYKWYLKRRIGSIGMLWGRNGGGWLGHFLSEKPLRNSILTELVEEKSLQTISVEGIDEVFYIRQEDICIFNSIDEGRERGVRFLAPLDNLLWDRGMTEKVFDFEYSWEVYVPAEKRKYGYYVLPVLYGNEIVARFEPEKQRKNDPLKIINWWWEEGIVVTKEMKHAVQKALFDFCEYLQADGIHRDSAKI
ncbi:MAG TPA: crosslink repair DNA glycosylase YcaQ family protein [Patescibacteria group bacterium]|nr:crosslink repair DNA glycosylase YcaQ family protein [Patescibacteria group bacterium]